MTDQLEKFAMNKWANEKMNWWIYKWNVNDENEKIEKFVINE